MKLRNWLILPCSLVLPLALLGACGDSGGGTDSSDESESGGTDGSEQCDVDVEGPITEDTVWTCGKILKGQVVVDSGATLTVEAGVTVLGRNGSALIIQKGAKLEAVGTETEPVVFTSSQPAGSRNRGDWGGIVFLGEASTNLATAGQAEGLAGEFTYGGSDDAYSCGTLQYVRVEFAGYELTTDNELNGITFYACGSGTTVDHVQVHMGQDDGFEWFGGTFNASYLISSGSLDDSFDIDQGFRGNLDYLFVHQDPVVANYAFEISNQGTNLGATPRTAPVISYATAVGSGGTGDTKSAGVRFKEGTNGEIHSSIITNFDGAQIDLTEPETEAEALAGKIVVQNNIFWNNGLVGDEWNTDDGSTFTLQAWVEDAANGNMFVDPQLASATWTSPDITPGAPEAAGVGAARDSNWTTASWTNFASN